LRPIIAQSPAARQRKSRGKPQESGQALEKCHKKAEEPFPDPALAQS
jgi:hypothetical protein